MGAGVGGLVQVYEPSSQVLLNGALEGRAAVGDGKERGGADIKLIKVFQKQRPFSRIDVSRGYLYVLCNPTPMVLIC